MRVRIEIAGDQPDEVVIRCREWNDDVKRLQEALEDALRGNELSLTRGDTVYFVRPSDILFFETDDATVKAHTRDAIYSTDETLTALEARLPRCFARVSKSCILNSAEVTALSRGVTGTGEVEFANSSKRAYVSRMYYKALKNLIYETRIAK